MLFGKKLNVKKLDCGMDTAAIPTIQSARLVYISGKGALKRHAHIVPDSSFENRYLSSIRLNGIPLVQISSPGCPTCASILATGYGIEKANCRELEKVRDAVNAPFVSLDRSIDDLSPILTLLESGLYVIADAVCFPTGGDGNFFWNAPNEPTESPATAAVLLTDDDYEYVSGQPVYLYPTQNGNCYNEERVCYYMDLFRQREQPPRAIVYNFGEFINFVLDGHHRACAAALLKRPLNCIVIIPYDGTGYKQVNGKMKPHRLYFSSISVPVASIPRQYIPRNRPERATASSHHMSAGIINHCAWDNRYLRSAWCYPTVEEYAQVIAAKYQYDEPVDDAIIEACLALPNGENQQRLKAILTVMRFQEDSRLKHTAMACAQKCPRHSKAAVLAYRILAHMKNDPEIEQFFLDYLIDHTDKYDVILPIVNSYWG